MNTIHIYTDGACSGNPGKGGYGAVLTCGNNKKELSGSFRKTTNNRMELMAAIAALECLRNEGSRVILTSDSKYLVDAINQNWIEKWARKGFANVKNADLWKRLIAVIDRHDVTFKWVKGHSGDVFNERCDALAVNAYNTDATAVDEGFESSLQEEPTIFDKSECTPLTPEEILTQEFGADLCSKILSVISNHNLTLMQCSK